MAQNTSYDNLSSTIVEDVFKSTDEVVNRIFNHKPFLEAAIRSMVKDMEEEPNRMGEVDQVLNGSFDRVKNVKETQIECIRDYCDIKFPALIDQVERIEEMMGRVLTAEQSKEEDRKMRMDHFITLQNEGLTQFIQQMDKRINDIDTSFERAREEVHLKYSSKANEKS